MRPLAYNIDFELAVMILLLMLSGYLYRHFNGNSKNNIALRRAAHVEALLIFFDILATITVTYADVIPIAINYIINVLYYSCIGLSTFCVLLFIESFSPEDKDYTRFNRINMIFYAIYVAINVIGIWTGWVFSIDNNRAFLFGPIHNIVYVYPGILIIECLIIFIIMSHTMERVQNISIILLLIFSGLGATMQLYLFPDILLANVTPGLALFICLFTVVSPNYQELTTKKNELEKAKSELEQQVIERTAESRAKQKRDSEMADEMIEAMKTMIDDSNTNRENHSENVSRLSVLIAKEMGFSKAEREKLYSMAVVHDIGIIGIDEEVALKTGIYTPEERKEMQRHPLIGEQILKPITEMPELAVAARSHHERYDGKGYPDHLKGDEIPIFARIICVADSYDAMTEKRPYREVFTKEHVKSEFQRCAGKQYDPRVVRALIHVMDKNEYTPAGEDL